MTATWSDTGVTWSDLQVTWAGGNPRLTPFGVIEVAFDNDPVDASPTWTDITAYVRGFSTWRGRQTELDRMEAGTASLLLDNLDQRFDPNNTASPYAGKLRPMKRIRILGRWEGTKYPIFSGLVKAWPQAYPGQVDAVVPLECVDLFRALNLNDLGSSYASELTGTRVTNVLTSAGWPTGASNRDIDTGQSTLQAATLSGSPLAHLQEVATSESGLFFMSGDGKATFVDRHTRLLTALDTDLTFGDGAGELPYLDIEFLDAEVTLWNDIDVTANALATQTATDSTSQTRYFARHLTIDTLLSTTDQMSDLANYSIARFKEPGTRVSRLVVTGSNGASTYWPQILGREIGDKIRVKRRPTADGDTITQDSVIEGIAVSASPADWKVAWTLSPTEGAEDYWILDDPVQSILDTSTRLAY